MKPSQKKAPAKRKATSRKKATPKRKVAPKQRVAPKRKPSARLAPIRPDPTLDLVLERTIDVPVGKVWRAWTEPKHLVKWFAPRPWKTVSCEIDLRPGGSFKTVMQSPEGENFPGEGCYLEVAPERRLVWTDALLGGYRPAEKPFFTGVISMEPKGKGTLYRAIAIHRDEAGRKQHAEMGFHEGWGAALNQLVEVATKL